MYLNVQGHKTYCYTGGKPFDAAKPTVVFIHGVLNDHSVWILQTRYLANHGWNVLAVDLPGHCKSEGEAPASVEEAAGFVAALLDAAGVQRAALVGHSWGSLIALEAAARLKDRVSHLVLVGTAFPMKVSQALLDAALNEPMKALAMVNTCVLTQHAGTAAGRGQLGARRQHGAGPARAGQQHQSQPVPPRLQGLRQLCQRRCRDRPGQLPGAVCAGRAGPDDDPESRTGPAGQGQGQRQEGERRQPARGPPPDERNAGSHAVRDPRFSAGRVTRRMAAPLVIDTLAQAVEHVLATVQGDIVLGLPLGIGKPNPFVNLLYRRIKAMGGDAQPRRLTIITALSLERPEGKSELEQHFLAPLVERVFKDYPDLDYVKDLRAGELPAAHRGQRILFEDR
jgi:pimeloyl-ACP methyl ester carboxylesterase